MKIKSKNFRVKPYKNVKLDDWPTLVDPYYTSKKSYQEMLQERVEKLSSMQKLHYASNQHALLLIFQGMDTAGKDGAIRHVLSGVNPQGCEVFSFKQPSVEELEHDFLWRTNCRLPERGKIGVFNRSYYEEVLVVRVHPEILINQGLSKQYKQDKDFWKKRYRSIRDMEEHLYCNGTRIVKFYLHLSKKEQKKRFLERIDDPEKNWKLSPADNKERQYWSQYARAYEECFKATSTAHNPWHIVPADDKENARLIIAQTILDVFGELEMSYPTINVEQKKELAAMRKELTQN